ncbi:4Fe-4S ferredoxin [Gordonibacter sp. An230]|uniref:4Fe-4S dicluster domain-containing protein n=1 Tax=Gordonibacter sp. An230 TaxID=1965592 RepID=UPI000B36E161|nr:4Fe-4S dicluster domain-containing protein [Gordonibacter sp. An230]OUO86078.1 4Fe-4S ferredoxin [Gordonibacter sp. An230]
MAEKAILFDSSFCTGCHGCQIACKCWNNLPSPTGLNESGFSGTHQNPPDLNGHTRLIMTYNELEGGSKGVMWAFGRRACRHCSDAPCAGICPSGALRKDEETGMVAVERSKCVGCQYCSTACPFDVPRYEASGPLGQVTIVEKCTGCVDRIRQGMAPACVTTCQPGALRFGDREEMLEVARERVEVLKGRGYEDAVLYGENEMGGLHVIYVLKYGVEAHGQVPNPQASPMADLVGIMKPLTAVGAGAAVLGFAAMFGLGVGYKRKKLAYNPETGDTIDVETGEVVKHGDGQDEQSVKEHIFENLPVRKGDGHE